MQPLKPRLLCIAALATFPLLARPETVTLFQSVTNAPRASSPAYTNLYSFGPVVSNIVGTNTNSFASWIVEIRASEVLRVVFEPCNSETWFDYPGIGYSPGIFSRSYNAAPVIVGPARVAIGQMDSPCYLTLAIQRNDEFTGPQNTVAIPPDASGPVTVKMETSTNLVEWVAAAPGYYGVSASMRYFRLRAIRDTP